MNAAGGDAGTTASADVARGARGLVVFGFCLALALPVLLAALIWYDLDREAALGVQRADVVAQAVARDVSGRLARIADALRRRDAGAGGFEARAADDADHALRDIVVSRDGRIVDAQGLQAAAPWLPRPGASTGASGLAIGTPARDARSHWSIPLALAFPDGHRIGAMVDADWFAQALAGYPVGEGGMLNLVHADRVLLARSEENQRYVGTRLDRSPIFDAAHRALPSGSFVERSVIDGVGRAFVFRRIDGAPLIVVVGIARTAVLAAWWRFAAIALAAALMLGALWIWLGRAYGRAQARQAGLLAEVREQSRRGEEARRIAALGDWTFDLATGEVQWSDEIFRIYGMTPQPGPLPVAEVLARFHPEDRERAQRELQQLHAGGDPIELVYRIVRPDGDVRTIYLSSEWADRERRVLRGIQQDVTELAKARMRLRDAHQEYLYLFENNPLPMWIFARDDLRFLAVNDAAIATYGYTREEWLARRLPSLHAPEDAADVAEAVRVNAAGRPQGSLWTHLRKDGRAIRVEIHARDIEFRGVAARLVLGIDVTDRERNEQRFALIARATSDAIWDWDVASGTTWRSDSFFALFGYARSEVAPELQGWADLIHPDDRERAVASVQRGIDSQAMDWEERFRFRRRDGSYADVIDRGALLRDERGKVIRAVGGMIDVTQRNRDEVDLRMLRRAVESADNGVVVADARLPGLPAVYVNAAFERMTGYSVDELIGSSFHFLREGSDEQPEVAAIRNAIAEEREVRVLLRDRRKDGTEFWNDFHFSPVRDDDGSLTHFISIQTDVTERQRAQEQLAYRATHDELTALPNRQLLVDRLQQAVLNAERHPRPVAVLFIDLDDFKLINDGLGHSAGDETLRMVARRLEEVVGDTDTVGRFGGDEFVVLLTERADDAGVAEALMRVNAALARPFEMSGVDHYINASIGWCRFPESGSDAEVLLRHADVAMYKAKQSGRNCVVAYEPAFDVQVSERLRLVSELRQALQRQEFVLAFQPLFDMRGDPVALEALVRWQHPERGLLLPGHFIGVCEDSGLIVPLGRWVLDEAARHHALLAAHGFGKLRIAVNVSALQFQQDLYADVASVVQRHALPRGVLELELTESVIMASPDAAIAVMRRLDALGVSISVDDFGTGYSSLAYLKRLPIDRLKIDRSFVKDLGNDDDDEAICTSIIRLAHSLGLGTVAEGVETQAQLDWLRDRGCDVVQGYLLGRPQPFAVMLDAIRTARASEAGHVDANRG